METEAYPAGAVRLGRWLVWITVVVIGIVVAGFLLITGLLWLGIIISILFV